MAECIFCKIIAKELPSHIIFESEHFISFLDVMPVNPGHILIIPKVHSENVFSMPQDLYDELFDTAKALSAPLQKAMGSARVGMVVEGFGVPHVHLHLVPIDHHGELDSSRAKKVPDEELAENAGKIKNEIEINKNQ